MDRVDVTYWMMDAFVSHLNKITHDMYTTSTESYIYDIRVQKINWIRCNCYGHKTLICMYKAHQAPMLDILLLSMQQTDHMMQQKDHNI